MYVYGNILGGLMLEHSPVILFVYKRYNHTLQTIEALANNDGADKTDLFIFSDAARSDKDVKPVGLVRDLIKNISGFKSVTVNLRSKNYGLAKNIIDGVTEISRKFSQFIVVEDDIVTSPYFLKFMNQALNLYKNNKKVWHIAGWNYPINPDGLADTFLWQLMNCWGWATWSDRWCYFERDPDKLLSCFSSDDIKRFNLNHRYTPFWNILLDDKNGTINTWDVCWYATIFKKGGLCLNPVQSFTKNIGHDDSGEHCGGVDIYKTKLSMKKAINFEVNEFSNNKALELIRQFYYDNRLNFCRRVLSKYLPSAIKRPIKKVVKIFS